MTSIFTVAVVFNELVNLTVDVSVDVEIVVVVSAEVDRLQKKSDRVSRSNVFWPSFDKSRDL